MKIIFRARDLTEAHIVSGLLKTNGIDNHVGGHYLQGGIGELAAADFATVLVADENVEQAAAIVAEYENNNEINNKTTKEKTEKKPDNFITPVIVIIVSILLIVFLTFLFSEQ